MIFKSCCLFAIKIQQFYSGITYSKKFAFIFTYLIIWILLKGIYIISCTFIAPTYIVNKQADTQYKCN